MGNNMLGQSVDIFFSDENPLTYEMDYFSLIEASSTHSIFGKGMSEYTPSHEGMRYMAIRNLNYSGMVEFTGLTITYIGISGVNPHFAFQSFDNPKVDETGTIAYSIGSGFEYTTQFISGNDEILSIDNDGKNTAKRHGDTTITATITVDSKPFVYSLDIGVDDPNLTITQIVEFGKTLPEDNYLSKAVYSASGYVTTAMGRQREMVLSENLTYDVSSSIVISGFELRMQEYQDALALKVGDQAQFRGRLATESGILKLKIIGMDFMTADEFVEFGNSIFSVLCSTPGTITEANWTNMQSRYALVNEEGKAVLKKAEALYGGTAMERFLSTYEYVVMTYGYDDYIGWGIAPSQNHVSSSNSMAIPLLCIFFIALLGGGTVLVIIQRKRAR